MGQKQQIFRILWLVDQFSNPSKGYTYEEVKNKIENEQKLEISYSEKTFRLDRGILKSVFDMEIVYKQNGKKYSLKETSEDTYRFIGESLLLVYASKELKNQKEVMLFQENKAKGLEHLYELIEAIKLKKIISCNHSKFWDTLIEKKILEPYALKEFENRWYLLAMDRTKNDGRLRTYGLDRISDLEISNSTFTKEDVDVTMAFKNSFGIISSLGQEPETIVLSFDAEQGKYIKALPLHSSQKILVDNAEELQIELKLVPSYDFYQELLKQAGRMKVIAPKSVKEEYINWLKKGLELNN
ncbi:MAG: WYL domain-containing protein [Bacteroidetes bacterium]|jgi:predicted DNA-binding transcriptional regulator YafY|nr:WYL domain-containing protein [Bacteroidota bacterium]